MDEQEINNGAEEQEQEPLPETEEEEEAIEASDADQEERDLDFILDIPLELSVELGRTKMLVNDLLQLGQGSIVELNKLAGEPLEICINQKLVARGEWPAR